MQALLVVPLFASHLRALPVTPKTHDVEFTIKSSFDTAGKRIISINDSENTYGPTIIVQAGDRLRLTIKNRICSEDDLNSAISDKLLRDYCTTSIHFHGLLGIGNMNDGVPNVTQDPIQPNEEYTYDINIPDDTCGTFWYHSHSSVQYGDGLRGVILVNCDKHNALTDKVISVLESTPADSLHPRSHLDMSGLVDDAGLPNENTPAETIITLTDMYDRWGFDILKYDVMAPDGGPDPSLTGSMINGMSTTSIYEQIEIDGNYLKLRVLNTGMSGTQIFHVENHFMIVIETDGILVKPYILDTLSLAVGQRYTVIVKRGDNEEFLRIINGCNKMMGYYTKELYLVKDQAVLEEMISNPHKASLPSIRSLPGLDKNELFRDLTPIARTDTESSLTTGLLTDTSSQYSFDYVYNSDEATIEKYGTGMYSMKGRTFQEYQKSPAEFGSVGDVVEVVINSVDHMRHPWHLHGHHFQLVSIGTGREGSLDKSHQSGRAWQKYEEDMAYWRETGTVPIVRDSINIPGGSFAVIRFQLSEAGSWLFHCHVEWHMAKGLGLAFHINEAKSKATSAEVADPSTAHEVPEVSPLSTDKGSDNDYAPSAGPNHNKNERSPKKTTVLLVYFAIMVILNYLFYKLIM